MLNRNPATSSPTVAHTWIRHYEGSLGVSGARSARCALSRSSSVFSCEFTMRRSRITTIMIKQPNMSNTDAATASTMMIWVLLTTTSSQPSITCASTRPGCDCRKEAADCFGAASRVIVVDPVSGGARAGYGAAPRPPGLASRCARRAAGAPWTPEPLRPLRQQTRAGPASPTARVGDHKPATRPTSPTPKSPRFEGIDGLGITSSQSSVVHRRAVDKPGHLPGLAGLCPGNHPLPTPDPLQSLELRMLPIGVSRRSQQISQHPPAAPSPAAAVTALHPKMVDCPATIVLPIRSSWSVLGSSMVCSCPTADSAHDMLQREK